MLAHLATISWEPREITKKLPHSLALFLLAYVELEPCLTCRQWLEKVENDAQKTIVQQAQDGN